MAHLNFKVTRWEKIHIPDELVNEVIEHLKTTEPDEVYDLLNLTGVYYDNICPDDAAEEPVLVSENDDYSTQELYDSNGDIIYQNGTKDID